ncbi:M15 family metallopeptidase [Escherichia coli]|uniref:M15 family metallopeptidase n=1 Tax=Escherichia coli TaxID=562 RepID=UPI000BE14983|nr:M15 family metallopeptidase [Escherichia coli]
MSDTTELVDLAVIFPDLEIELKYACADNITGKAIYQQARCLLHKDAITALAKSISIAQLSGLQLVIYDAYRPQQAQAMLWQACPDPQYVVDVTAVRLTTGDLRCVSPTTSTGDVVASLPRPAICC